VIAIAIINYKTAEATLACVAAVLAHARVPLRIHLLDNGSGDADAQRLRTFASRKQQVISFVESETNLGFAAGMNLLLKKALADPQIEGVLLLNSDTQPAAGFLDAMIAGLDSSQRIDMVAARMLHPQDLATESLGIALYKSTLASNRKSEKEVLLGPTGGCALLSRRLLEDLLLNHGEWFDEAFFCYAEDTDLVLRARWLNYKPAFAAEAVVYHVGSLSSGGPESEFVLYHGIRNSLWWLAKDAPTSWLLRSMPWFLALHVAIILRHLRRGRVRVLWRLYRDAARGMPTMLRKRRTIAATRLVPTAEFSRWVEPRFYERAFLTRAWRELWLPRSKTK
jgi:N-acetylglucosaminyl-diphospho-decaprenol L-rhamnosyltransferase